MLESHLAALRLMNGEPLKESDMEIMKWFSFDVHKEIKNVSFDQLFRRSWHEGEATG